MATSVARLLIEKGAEVDKVMNYASPRFTSRANSHVGVVWLLIQKGAKVDKATVGGTTHCTLRVRATSMLRGF